MFSTDQQTLKDLQIFSQHKSDPSILAFFDEVSSYGGKTCLEAMLRKPFSDAKNIGDRVELIEYLERHSISIDIDREALDFIEHYLALPNVPTRYSRIDGVRKRLAARFKPSNNYYVITRAVKWLIEIITNLGEFAAKSYGAEHPATFGTISRQIEAIVGKDDFAQIRKHKGLRLSAYEVVKFDHILRYLHKSDVRSLLEIIYQLDVYCAVIAVKARLGLTFAEISGERCLEVEGLFHPFITDPVANDLALCDSNVGFITGANMAGKSTFMKAFGVAAYLAHAGFPVPARRMRFSVFDGLVTAINVPDDLSLGYSHFYAEVRRIKSIAEMVGGGRKFIVILDELFRGTNVKDACEATISIVKGLSAMEESVFLFSSHMLEVADELKALDADVQFRYFKTELNDGELVYSYRMHSGISDDRFGMYIINREGILDMLEKKKGR